MELKITIDATQDVLDAIKGLANAINGVNPAPTTETIAETVVTKKPKKVTEVKEEIEEDVVPVKLEQDLAIEDIRALAQKIAQSGKREEIKTLLAEFDVAKVTDLEEADYSTFYNKLNAL